LQEMARNGFETVRLPVAFDHFLVGQEETLEPMLLQQLDRIYRQCRQLNMNLVLVYHYGKLRNENPATENERIIKMWKQVMRSFVTYDPNHLFYELYNEPTTDMDVWKSSANTLVRELRKEDPDRIFIIGGANYNGINELLDMGPLLVDDGKIIYTFHFYEPYVFTHQGADWTKEKTYVTGFPYPYQLSKMPDLPAAAQPGSTLVQDYARYYKEATPAYLKERLGQIAQRANDMHLPLICSETGVIQFADKKSKSAYLGDITAILDQLGIPVMLWDYNDKFSLKKGKKLLSVIRQWTKP
jgi:endoglucanase